MQYSVGVDLGSTAIKVVFVQNNTLIWHKAIPTAPGQEALANKVIEEGIRELDISKDDILGVAATGYGKNLMNSADKVIDEVSANAFVIPVWNYDGKHDPVQMKAEILSNPSYQTTKAGKNKNVIMLPAAHVLAVSQYTVNAVEDIAKAVYPENFN